MGHTQDLKKCVVALDTSVLMLIAQGICSLDSLYEAAPECEFVVPDVVVEELKRLESSQQLKKARLASWVLNNVVPRFRVFRIGLLPNERRVDDALIRAGKTMGIAVATADLELKRELERHGVRVIYFRSAKRGFESSWRI